jgi:hypothetical protein
MLMMRSMAVTGLLFRLVVLLIALVRLFYYGFVVNSGVRKALFIAFFISMYNQTKFDLEPLMNSGAVELKMVTS